MEQTRSALSVKQAKRLFGQLSPTVKIQLIRLWEQETWPSRFRRLLARIDQRLQQHPAVRRDALKAVGPARRAFYARRARH